jgi:hypothetical protein
VNARDQHDLAGRGLDGCVTGWDVLHVLHHRLGSHGCMSTHRHVRWDQHLLT